MLKHHKDINAFWDLDKYVRAQAHTDTLLLEKLQTYKMIAHAFCQV